MHTPKSRKGNSSKLEIRLSVPFWRWFITMALILPKYDKLNRLSTLFPSVLNGRECHAYANFKKPVNFTSSVKELLKF